MEVDDAFGARGTRGIEASARICDCSARIAIAVSALVWLNGPASAPAAEAGPSAGHNWIRISGDYSKINPEHPEQGLAKPHSIEVGNVEENTARNDKEFRADEDLVLDRVVFTQWDLPIDEGDPSMSSDGDLCLYARTPRVDPGASGLFCIASYTTATLPLQDGDPVANGRRGTVRQALFPEGAGLFIPKGTTLSCPSHLHRRAGGAFSSDQLSRARWSCRIEHHPAGPTETVGRIARIPYLDTFFRPRQDGQMIDPSMTWYRGGDGSNPMVVAGFLVYASTIGLRPSTDNTRSYHDVCLNKVESQSLKVLQSECIPDFTYYSNQNAPTKESPEGFIKFKQPMVVRGSERLTGSCKTAPITKTDCAIIAVFELPPRMRIPAIGEYFWDAGNVVDQQTIGPGGRYCMPDSLATLSPAGKQTLRLISQANAGPWANSGCSAGDLTCGCHNLFRPYQE